MSNKACITVALKHVLMQSALLGGTALGSYASFALRWQLPPNHLAAAFHLRCLAL